MKILEQFFLITGICANISIIYIHYKFYIIANRNNGDERLNLKNKNVNFCYVDNSKKAIDGQIDVLDKLRCDKKEENDETTGGTEEDGHLRQEGDIENRLRRVSDLDEGDMDGDNWVRYLSFGVK